jgi:signal transduction histidine kinase
MRSVHARIFTWFICTLAFSTLAFVMIYELVSNRSLAAKPTPAEINAMLLEGAKQAYESGDAEKLIRWMKWLDQALPGEHYFTDAQGKDLITGEDRSSLLAPLRSEWGIPKRLQGHTVVGSASSDGRYRLIIALRLPFGVWPYLPYYVLILLAIGTVCWALAINIASPLRALARTVERFGRGELSVRVNSHRRDEIGALGAAFDSMANHVETLLHSERRLLQDISHELRSPLVRLSFAAELVRTAENRDAAVARLKKEIDRLTHLVTALLETASAEGYPDPSSSNMEEIYFDVILNEVVEDSRVEAAEKGCGIKFSANSHLVSLGNSELLRRAFENIVRNAIHYTPEGSTVDVKLEVNADTGRITVRDCGPGVPEELLTKIFQPFFRVDDSRDSSTGGVGLGLAIARHAVDVHNGRLWAENMHPGLMVQIEFPLGNQSKQIGKATKMFK